LKLNKDAEFQRLVKVEGRRFREPPAFGLVPFPQDRGMTAQNLLRLVAKPMMAGRGVGGLPTVFFPFPPSDI